MSDGGQEVVVFGLGQRDVGEEVGDDAVEERQVTGEKFRQVDVQQRAEDERLFRLAGRLHFQVTSGYQHRFHRSHTCKTNKSIFKDFLTEFMRIFPNFWKI